MKAKNQGQLKTENRMLKQKVRKLENEVKVAHAASPEGQLIQEFQQEKAARAQLAENCRYYRGQVGDRNQIIDSLEEQVYRAEQRLTQYQEHIQDQRESLNRKEWKIAELVVQCNKKEQAFNLLGACYATTVILFGVFEGLRFFGVL